MYTILDQPTVDNEIQKHMDQALQLFLANKDRLGLKSVILVGSFGRGEGSVLLDQGHVRPLNDYDFLLVTDRLLIPQRALNEISGLLARKLNMTRIDLKMVRYSNLHKLPNTIYFYEAKYGGKLLWGTDSLALMPSFKSVAIPLWDGAFLLFARTVALILAYPPTCQEDDHFVVEQCLKAVFACSEAMLILYGRYHYSYAERSRCLTSLLSRQTEPWYFRQLADLIAVATRFKLTPDYSLFPNPHSLWHDVAHMFWPIFLHYMSSTYRSTQDIDDVVSKFLNAHCEPSFMNIPIWLDFWRNSRVFPPVLSTRILTHRPMLLVCAALPYFLLSMLQSDQSYLRSVRYLSKVLPVKNSISFSSAIKTVIDAWETSVH